MVYVKVVNTSRAPPTLSVNLSVICSVELIPFNLMMFCFRYYVMVLELVSVVTVSVMHPRLTEENIAMNAR